MIRYKVYFLSDPRYYGVTQSSLDRRLRNHYQRGYYYGSCKDKWLEGLFLEGVRASITLLAEYEDKTQALALETSLIANGVDLLNLVTANGSKDYVFNNDFRERSSKAGVKRNKDHPQKRKLPPRKRKLVLTSQEREIRIARLRPFWFKGKV